MIRSMVVHSAVCGPKAVEDVIREFVPNSPTAPQRITLRDLAVDRHAGMIRAIIRFGEPCLFANAGEAVVIRAPERGDWADSWESAVEFINQRQASMPPHLRGYDHNADEATAFAVKKKVEEQTGYDLWPIDFWVRIADGSEMVHEQRPVLVDKRLGPNAGTLMFGAITQAGSIAMNKYEKLNRK